MQINSGTVSDGEDAWIGFNDMLDESLFNWADGSQVEYTQWAVGQPNHILNDNQDCVLMQANVSHLFVD
ncbi:hypothetical protein DPMN_114989 [Dreissena polymorpha]|uniref:C-type lectin domain-containing protein n=1 Tax=Dreissena polymorpha TaxID=45954 RepID=A0A9D4KL56_DREPO|nr:hypothetical protein DPMN_114989 [Dreissena polymorpha]